jgi:hypothetical protein
MAEWSLGGFLILIAISSVINRFLFFGLTFYEFIGASSLILGASYGVFRLRRTARSVAVDDRGICIQSRLGRRCIDWRDVSDWSDAGMHREHIVLRKRGGGRFSLNVERFEDPGALYWTIQERLNSLKKQGIETGRWRHARRFDATPASDMLFGLGVLVMAAALIQGIVQAAASGFSGDPLGFALLSGILSFLLFGLDRSHTWHRVSRGRLQKRTLFTWISMPLDEQVRAVIRDKPAPTAVFIRRGRRIILSPGMPGFGALVEEALDHLTPGQIEGDAGLLQEIPPPESPLPLESTPELREDA